MTSGNGRIFFDGVCISGGEPTIQPGLLPFLDLIRAADLKIKLIRTEPALMFSEQVLASGKADYIAMDVKAPWEKYPLASGWGGNIESVKESISSLVQKRPSSGPLSRVSTPLKMPTLWVG